MTWRHLWRSAVPADRTVRRLGLATFVDAIGTGLFLAGGTVFLARDVHLRSAQIGLGFSIAAVAGLGTLIFGGQVIDRYGSGRMFVALQVYRMLVFAAYPFVSGFGSFLLVACLIAGSESLVPPTIQAVVSDVTHPSKRLRTMAYLRSVMNLGDAVGAALAIIVLSIGSRLLFDGLFWADAATFLVSAVLLHRVAAVVRPASVARTSNIRPFAGISLVWRNRPFVGTSLLNGVLCLHITLLSIGIPLLIVQQRDAPTALVGLLLMVNTVLVVTIQLRLSRPADSPDGPVRVYRWSGQALAACCVCLAATTLVRQTTIAVPLLIMAVLALTLGEIWQASAQWGAAYRLAPEDRRGSYLAMFGFGTNLQRIAGPSLIAWVLVGRTLGWLLLAGALLLAGHLAGQFAGVASRRVGGEPSDPAPRAQAVMHRQPAGGGHPWS
jgi:MFS family permease